MIPTVAQQIGAVRNTIAKTVMPALDPDDSFAAEQAGLALACLDWVLDVQESEYDYEVVEHADYRAALAALLTLPADGDDGARALIDETAAPPSDMRALRGQVRSLKAQVTEAFHRRAQGSDEQRSGAQKVMVELAVRQSERELSWCRMTGFPQGQQPAIAELLSTQR